MPVTTKVPFCAADGSHPWPIRVLPAPRPDAPPLPATHPRSRRNPKLRVRYDRCASRSGPVARGQLRLSGRTIPNSWPARAWRRDAAAAPVSPDRSQASPASHSANELCRQNDRHQRDDTFPTGQPRSTRPPEGIPMRTDRPASPGPPNAVSRFRHPDDAANLHRGERFRRTPFACRLPRIVQ